MKNKRFLLFAWPSYRTAGGGWEDFIGSYDTAEEARKDFDEDFDEDFNNGGDECYNIVNITTMQIVLAGTYGQAARKLDTIVTVSINCGPDITYPIDDSDKCGLPTKPKEL